MNVLSYENYCLKVKLQELLEKMARIQGEKIEKDVIELFSGYMETRLEPFQEQLNKLETTEK